MFIYTIVNPGSEKLLKEEIAYKYPNLSFAYSRPGYLTFKDRSENFDSDSRLNLVFARSYGMSLGRFTPETVEDEIKKYPSYKVHRFSLIKEEFSGETAKLGDTVLDVIEVKEGEIWLGTRKIEEFCWKYPGANPHLSLPEESPSRAYLKIAEALLWADYDYKDNENVLDLGSAPGGSSYALLERGFRVWGVDNALMSDTLLKNPMFTHLKDPMQRVHDDVLPRPCHILISDVNVLPSLNMGQIKRFTAMRPSIHTVFYTLEIGEKISVREILDHIKTFKYFGFKEVRATQLPSHKSEVLLYGKK
ncbi:MAG: SAM-dependent methyltransferase, partial [Fusobacteriaceae bacterium]